MKNLKSIVSASSFPALFLCALFFAAPAIADDTAMHSGSWTPKAAVIFALKNSPDSRIAAQRINAASSRRAMAESSLRPRLNLSAGYDQTNNPMYSFGNILNQGSFDQTIDFNNPGRTDNLNLKAEMLYRFYNGGRDKAGIRCGRISPAVHGNGAGDNLPAAWL